MKDEINYEVQSYDNDTGEWYTLDVFELKKEAKTVIRDCKYIDEENGLKLKYRIVKLIIKREVVK